MPTYLLANIDRRLDVSKQQHSKSTYTGYGKTPARLALSLCKIRQKLINRPSGVTDSEIRIAFGNVINKRNNKGVR